MIGDRANDLISWDVIIHVTFFHVSRLFTMFSVRVDSTIAESQRNNMSTYIYGRICVTKPIARPSRTAYRMSQIAEMEPVSKS